MQIRLSFFVIAVTVLVVSAVYAVSAQQAAPPSQDQRPLLSLPTGEQPVTSTGIYTLEQARRGLTLYRVQCVYCHNEELTGGGPEDSLFVSPPLVGPLFRRFWLNRPLEQLLTKISTTMPQYEPGTLTRQQSVDLLAYILWESNYPDGDTELPADDGELEGLTFTYYK